MRSDQNNDDTKTSFWSKDYICCKTILHFLVNELKKGLNQTNNFTRISLTFYSKKMDKYSKHFLEYNRKHCQQTTFVSCLQTLRYR